MHSLKFDDVQPIRQDSVRLPLQQMFGLVGGDMRDRGENVRTVGRGPFDAIPVVDSAFTRFMVDVEVLKIVVEINAASAQVSSEKGCVGCEDCCHIDVTLAAKRNRETRLPLVEMCDNAF